MSKISLKHSGGNVVSLNSPTNAPGAADVAFKLPNADGSNGQAIVTDGSGNLSFGNVAGGSTRNLIINGAMNVAQRGTSFTNVGAQEYTLDRFTTLHSYGGTQMGVSQSSTSPDGFSNSYKLDVNTADTSIGAAEFVFIRHKLEAQDLQQLAYGTSGAKSITLSFYVRSNVTGTYAICLQQKDNSSKQVNGSYTINSADTWERKTFTYAGDTSGVINNDNGHGLDILWTLVAGSDRTSGSVRSTWTAHANADESVGHTANILSSTSNNFHLTGVQLEVGSVATDFEHRSFAQELALCQRYFQSITTGFVTACRGASSSMLLYSVTTPVNLRSSPTVASNSDLGHSSYTVRSYRDGSGTSDSTSTPSANSTYFRSEGNVVHLQQDGFSVTDDRSATIFIGGGAITMDSEL